MPNFIDIRLRVRKERLGDLVYDIPPYAECVGWDIVGPSKETWEVVEPAKETQPEIAQDPLVTVSRAQVKALKLIKGGTKTLDQLYSKLGRRNGATRLINCLVRKGYIQVSGNQISLVGQQKEG